MSRTYRHVVTWLDQALGAATEAIERIPERKFLAEHAAIHREARSSKVDAVAGAYEREFWRRFPDGRDE